MGHRAGGCVHRLLGKVPREFVVSALGGTGGLRGMLRATFGGLLLDLCNHGVLMSATRLYERGLSGGQMIAFLVASPWNSLSLTLILIALVGLPMTLAFTLLSFVVAVITGLIYERLVAQGRLPDNPNQVALPEDFRFWPQARARPARLRLRPRLLCRGAGGRREGVRMVMRWLLFGIVLASLVRVFVDTATLRNLVRSHPDGAGHDHSGGDHHRSLFGRLRPHRRGLGDPSQCPRQRLRLPDGRRRHGLHRGHGAARGHRLLEVRAVPAVDHLAASIAAGLAAEYCLTDR